MNKIKRLWQLSLVGCLILMSSAIQEGYNIDPSVLKTPAGAENANQLENLKKLGKIYYQARYGSGLDRVLGSLKLRLSFALYADQVTPVYDAFSAFIPVEQKDQYFLTTPRESILAEDLQTIDARFAKYRAERWLKNEDDVKEIKQHLTELLDEVYNLSIGIVSGSSSSANAQQEKFNALLKAI